MPKNTNVFNLTALLDLVIGTATTKQQVEDALDVYFFLTNRRQNISEIQNLQLQKVLRKQVPWLNSLTPIKKKTGAIQVDIEESEPFEKLSGYEKSAKNWMENLIKNHGATVSLRPLTFDELKVLDN